MERSISRIGTATHAGLSSRVARPNRGSRCVDNIDQHAAYIALFLPRRQPALSGLASYAKQAADDTLRKQADRIKARAVRGGKLPPGRRSPDATDTGK
ncbi:MAG: hypothetical protein J0H41_17210 [Rhizobiales bacterium]|nr:hypothetical protein [Hyphomicrobiales bacterium]